MKHFPLAHFKAYCIKAFRSIAGRPAASRWVPVKMYLLLLLLAIAAAANAQSVASDTLSLSGYWKFKIDPDNIGEEAGWFANNVSDANWDRMEVPGNWDLKNTYAHYAGKAWYRKEMVIPVQWRNSLVRLLFEGVNNDSKVWLNGKLLGTNNLGFLPFSFDINKLVNYGAVNTLVVCADNTFKRGALWNWGGIRRPVTMVATTPVFIDSLFITPAVNLTNRTALVDIRISVRNTTGAAANIKGNVLLTAKNGFARSIPFTARIAPGQVQHTTVSATVSGKGFELWDFDHPFLYNCQVQLQNNDGARHQMASRFGLRKVELDAANYQFKLNGRPVRLMGFNLVPDDRTTGNTLPLWRVKEDIDLMKSFGANLTRLSHLPMHHEMLDYLDEKGMLVFEEIPLWGFDPLVNKEKKEPFDWLHRMIKDHYNHPSIIGWGVGNEIGYVPTVMAYVDTAIQVVKSLDPSRMAVMVNHTADRGVDDPIRFSDFGLINKYGPSIGSLADRIHSLHPDKILFYSEFGYGQSAEHLDADINARAMMDSIRFKPYLVGGSLWTFNDYRSNYAYTKELSENRPWGIVDVFRRKKKPYDAFRKEYAPIREINVQLQEHASSIAALVQLTPRLPLDLPAYEMNNYVLAIRAYNDDGTIAAGDFRQLPLVRPGDAPVRETFSLPKSSGVAQVQVSLLTPLNYTVYDTILFLKAPAPPVIRSIKGGRTEMNDIRAGTGAIRIALDAPLPQVTYQATYEKDGQRRTTVPTRNPYIEIPGLLFGEVYQVSVQSVNGFGASAPTQPQAVPVEIDAVAPVIYHVAPADSGFFVGYRTQVEDYLYLVQYATDSSFAHAKSIQASAKGVLFVPHLQNGRKYYFRMQTIKQNNARTAWTETYTVTPDGQQLPQAPVLQGVLRRGAKALVCFEPVNKATGYTIWYKPEQGGQWQTAEVSASQIGQYMLDGLHSNKVYQFKMQSQNQFGQSAFTEEYIK